MDNPGLETIVRLPWGAGLPRSLVWYPERSETVGSDRRQSPEIPLVRVSRDGTVAILSCVGTRYLTPGTVQWWVQAPGQPVRARTAPYPFAAGGGTVTAVDFWVSDAGALVLLERTAADDGSAGWRLAAISPAGDVTHERTLDGGPYLRIVPDDGGRLFLVSEQGGGALVPFDAASGRPGAPIAIAPGSRAALAALRGAVLTARHLAGGDATKVAPVAGMPEALVFLFGVDREDNYYTVVGGELVSATFSGQVRRRVPLAGFPALVPAQVGPQDLQSRPARTAAWQVDADGRVYVPRVTADDFQVVRLSARP